MTTFLRILYLMAFIAPVIGAGTVFFHYAEGWSWIDSYFFAVVTLSTVGYGQLVPLTALGKIGTTVFIFLGLGIFAYVIQQVGRIAAERRAEHTEWLIGRLGHHKSPHEPDAANQDDRPPPP